MSVEPAHIAPQPSFAFAWLQTGVLGKRTVSQTPCQREKQFDRNHPVSHCEGPHNKLQRLWWQEALASDREQKHFVISTTSTSLTQIKMSHDFNTASRSEQRENRARQLTALRQMQPRTDFVVGREGKCLRRTSVQAAGMHLPFLRSPRDRDRGR